MKRPDAGQVTVEAALCALPALLFALAAGTALWNGLRCRMQEYSRFTAARAALVELGR
ncbi:MAG: hypothetical protein ACXVB9_22415 [Bdellovibrionota bacterium]